MTSETLTALAEPPAPAISGELVGASSLLLAGTSCAATKPAKKTRVAYLEVYQAFCGWHTPTGDLGAVSIEALTVDNVTGYRTHLEDLGRSPATIAKHLTALRQLAMFVGADFRIGNVKSKRGDEPPPKPITAKQLELLLKMPDLRTTAGKRDQALLSLLGLAGLRVSEVAALRYEHVVEIPRYDDSRIREAIKRSSRFAVFVEHSKRGSSRFVPLDPDALESLVAWRDSRPECSTDHIFVSLPRTNTEPKPLDVRSIARAVERHAKAADLPADRRSPHVLRHTFCTALAEAGIAIEVIKDLAGHKDIRTTMRYVDVSDKRQQQAIESLHKSRQGLAAVA